MRKILAGIAMAPGFAALLLLLFVSSIAMRRGGKVELDFNKHKEGWPEVFMFTISAAAWLWAATVIYPILGGCNQC